jgi:hypothetical protein
MIFRRRIIHIVDDEKFIDAAYTEFERIEKGLNIFILLSKKRKLRFIKSTPVIFIRPRVIMLLVKLLPIFTRSIIFHSLGREFEKNLILKIPKSISILWISWGFDICPYLKKKDQYLLGKTKKLINEFHESLQIQSLNNEFIQRVDYFSTVIPHEFDNLSEVFNISPEKYISWNYFTLEDDIIKGFSDQKVYGNNLLFGHSGSIWLNHYDAFEDLKRFSTKFDKIVCPLSYGDIKYSQKISELGTVEFGEKFHAILDFLPYEKYVKSLLSCKVVYFNSIRQIGMGNILLMLYLGATIVLRKENPVYQFLQNNGLPVYSVDELDESELSTERLLEIREILKNIWGREVIHQKTKSLIKIIHSR